MRKEVIEYTCDVCGSEIYENVLVPNIIELKGFTETFTHIELNLEVFNDICIYCFIKAVNKLSPKPKVVAK